MRACAHQGKGRLSLAWRVPLRKRDFVHDFVSIDWAEHIGKSRDGGMGPAKPQKARARPAELPVSPAIAREDLDYPLDVVATGDDAAMAIKSNDDADVTLRSATWRGWSGILGGSALRFAHHHVWGCGHGFWPSSTP
jgi:hypothetical protein